MQLEHMKARVLCWYIMQRLKQNSKTNSTPVQKASITGY